MVRPIVRPLFHKSELHKIQTKLVVRKVTSLIDFDRVLERSDHRYAEIREFPVKKEVVDLENTANTC